MTESTTPSVASPTIFQDRIREGLLRRAGLTQPQIDDALRTERETGQQLDQVLKLVPRDEAAKQLREEMQAKLPTPSKPATTPAPPVPEGAGPTT